MSVRNDEDVAKISPPKTVSRFTRPPRSLSCTHISSPSITSSFRRPTELGVQKVRPTKEPPGGHLRPNQDREASSTFHSYSWKMVGGQDTSVYPENPEIIRPHDGPQTVLFVAAPAVISGHPCIQVPMAPLPVSLPPSIFHVNFSASQSPRSASHNPCNLHSMLRSSVSSRGNPQNTGCGAEHEFSMELRRGAVREEWPHGKHRRHSNSVHACGPRWKSGGSTGRSGSCANRSSSSISTVSVRSASVICLLFFVFQIHERVARERSRSVHLSGRPMFQIPRGACEACVPLQGHAACT